MVADVFEIELRLSFTDEWLNGLRPARDGKTGKCFACFKLHRLDFNAIPGSDVATFDNDIVRSEVESDQSGGCSGPFCTIQVFSAEIIDEAVPLEQLDHKHA